jgi:predicted molibdopterin-dependent oxidoreductase YjgC
VIKIAIDGTVREAQDGELLIDLLNRAGNTVPQVCYHPQLGPVQTCDTCMVEANGRLVRACATEVADGMQIATKSAKAMAAQTEAFDPALAEERGIQSGTWGQLVSRYGQVRVRAVVTDCLRGLAAAVNFLQAFGRNLRPRPNSLPRD